MTGVPVRVSFRKQVSDGNYGTEAAEITLERAMDEHEDEDYIVAALLMQARRYVHAELARSPSPRVRAAVAPPVGRPATAAVLGPPDYDDEGDEAPF